MAQFARAAERILGCTQRPSTLWVTNSVYTDVMCEPAEGTQLDLGPHHDWLLAADDHRLVLVRIRGPRLVPDDIRFEAPVDGVEVRYVDVGELARKRIFTIAEPGRGWFAVSAPLGGRSPTQAFTDLLTD